MAFTEDGSSFDKSVSRWHPWVDKPGVRHVQTFLAGEGTSIHSTYYDEPLFHVNNLEEMVDTIAKQGLYCFSGDTLNVHVIPWAQELIGNAHVMPYVSRSGNIAALRVASRRKSGFLIPAKTWKWDGLPDKRFTRNVAHIFQVFGVESTTPSSLSEKVLRATLPEHVGIFRPSVWLRRDILENNVGGRVDMAVEGRFYREVREYDKNKAYLYHSRVTPSPYLAPVLVGKLSYERACSFPCGWFHVRCIAHTCLVHPVQVDGMNPVEGEVIDKWLWTGELVDCVEAGYTLLEICGGYGFRAMSNWMEPWSDLLYAKYEQSKDRDPHLCEIIKSMMVGLPGRFLRQPEQYKLIPLKEAKPGDVPLMMHWNELDDTHISEWAVHPEYDMESTALSHIGSYIVAEMRRELYHRMKKEVEHGYTVVRSYVDCYSVDVSRSVAHLYPQNSDNDYERSYLCHEESFRNIGQALGQWKEKRYSNVWAEGNRFVGMKEEQAHMVAPGLGVGSEGRNALWRRYWDIVQGQSV